MLSYHEAPVIAVQYDFPIASTPADNNICPSPQLREPVNPAPNRGTGAEERSGNIAEAAVPAQHQHCGHNQASFVTGIGAMISIAQSSW